jgi:hypothetical protein
MAEKSAQRRQQRGFTPSTNWKARSLRAKSVGEFVPALMRPAFEKYGFPAAAILTDWAAIAGKDLAAFTAPERLKWPRRASAEAGEAEQSGATLILRVDGPRALEVEHLRPRLIERINACFGYRAVADIRVLQAPIRRRKAPEKRIALPSPAAAEACAQVGDERLKQALAKIASGIEATRQAAAERPRA